MKPATHQSGIFKTILVAGLLAGTLDILAAVAWFLVAGGKDPERVLLFIASGYFGKAAFAGGEQMAGMGLLFHYLIAFAFTCFYFIVYPVFPAVKKNVLAVAVVFGIFTWIVMNLVVIPFSKITSATFKPLNVSLGIVILILFFALPITVILKRHFEKKLPQQ